MNSVCVRPALSVLGLALLLLSVRPAFGATDAELGWGDPAGLAQIPQLPPDDGSAFPIQKVRIGDARATKGFYWCALDGRLRTPNHGHADQEWPRSCNGVFYEDEEARALHLTPAPGESFNYLFLRGNYQGGELRQGVTVGREPWDGTLLTTVDLIEAHFRWQPSAAEDDSRLTFTYGGSINWRIRDVQLFRLGALAESESSAGSIEAHLAPVVADGLLAEERIARYYGAGDLDEVPLSTTDTGTGVSVAANQYLHLRSPSIPVGTALGAVQLNLQLTGASEGTPVRAVVYDPTNPRGELMNVDVRSNASGTARLRLDFEDQIVAEAGRHLWISLAVGDPVTLSAAGSDPAVEILTRGYATALQEYLPYRRTLLRHHFQVLSEPRPWDAYCGSLVGHDREDLLRELRTTLRDLDDVAPSDPIVRQYIEWVDPECEKGGQLGALPPLNLPQDVPRWAALEHLALQNYRDQVLWWFQNRMLENGEIGSGIGDDTDFYGQAINLAMLDPNGSRNTVMEGLLALNETLRAEGFLDRGLNTSTDDMLHAYEDGINFEGYLPFLRYGDPVEIERAMRAVKSLREVIDEAAPAGWLFRSPDIGAPHLDGPIPLPPGGSPYDDMRSFLMHHPSTVLAWYAHNPEALEFTCEHVDAWLAQFGGHDVYPRSLYLDGEIRTDHHRPGRHGFFPTLVGMLWLEARRSLPVACQGIDFFLPGRQLFDEDLFAVSGRNSFMDLVDVITLEPGWRTGILQGLQGKDDHAHLQGVGWRLETDPVKRKEHLETALEVVLDQSRRFDWMNTEAEPYADRPFLTPKDFPHDVLTRIALGGQVNRNKFFPNVAITFEGVGLDYASLVYESTPTSLRFSVVNMQPSATLEGEVRIWSLKHGTYRVRVGTDADDDGWIDSGAAWVDGTRDIARYDTLTLAVPARETVVYEISLEPSGLLDPLHLRPDLALAASETVYDEQAGTLETVVHNVGSADVTASFELAVTDYDGQVLVEEDFPSGLAAPVDLVPSRVSVAMTGLTSTAQFLRVDGDGSVAEITEVNNEVVLKEPCNDGVDNDGDGLTDYPADPGCGSPSWPREDPACNDGVDNDGDMAIDFDGGGTGSPPDPQCTSGAKRKEGACGLGFELVGLIPLLQGMRRFRRKR